MAPASTQVVDFSGVKDGGGSFNKKRVPSGDYLATVVKVEDAEAKSDGEFQYLFTIQLKQFSQYKYPYYCKLVESQLWKLRNILIAAGLSVPKRKQKLNPSKVVGRQIGVTMEDDEYEGKLQSTVASVFPASELSEGTLVTDDEDTEGEYEESGMDEFAPDEEPEEGDEFDTMDREELKQLIRGKDSAAKFKKSESDDDLRTRARAFEDEEEEEEPEEEEEEEEEEPPPPPKKRTARKRTAKKKTPPPADDDDELEELDIDDEL